MLDFREGRRLVYLTLSVTAILFNSGASVGGAEETVRIPHDVTLGISFVRGYQRVYPLLDGIFQDVSSTQLSPLMLNPNGANAANLNALQTAFQAGVSYSATAGATNAVAQQQNAVVATGAGVQNQLLNLQSQLFTQQSQLLQSALSAQQQVGAAQAQVDQLSKSSTATPEQSAAAAQALAAATDNLTAINAQIALVGNQLTAVKNNLTTAAAQSFTAPSTSAQQNPPTLPPQLTQLTTPPGAPTTPSFPSSKQMDNQINLLWERLSRIVGTLAQPDSLGGYSLALAEIDIGITPLNRKNQLLGVEYELTCPDGSSKPLVLDLFPSVSTINIVDTKYRETRVGLTAILSWFSTGINAAYNRDHLQLSQALGQSGYITGFGLGSSKFGWIFGRTLGDDMISTGTRRVVALVGAPSETCKTLTINERRAVWFKDKDKNQAWYVKAANPKTLTGKEYAHSYDLKTGQQVNAPAVEPNFVKSIQYAPAEYDPSAPGKTLVTVSIETDRELDPQQTVTVNGKVLKRSRDNFGRGVNATGAGGLLETIAIDPNSWLPVSSTTLTLTLDPSLFGRRFPEIQISGPSGSYSVMQAIAANKSVQVNGQTLDYGGAADLPPLGYPAGASTRNLLISHWHHEAADPAADPAAHPKDELLINAPGEQSSSSGAPGASSLASLQVISEEEKPVWGGDAVVLASYSGTTYRLSCSALGSRLRCKSPKNKADLFHSAFTLEVRDTDHPGGPIRAQQAVNGCIGNDCKVPLLWKVGTPEWGFAPGGVATLRFPVDLINVGADDVIQLRGGISGGAPVDTQKCRATFNEICSAAFLIPVSKFGNLSDSMLIYFGQTERSPTAGIWNLRSRAQPIVTALNDTQTLLTGQNLIFNRVLVGANTKLDLQCAPDRSECRIKEYPEAAEGYLNFIDDHNTVPVLFVKGMTATPVFRAAPKPKKPAKPSAAKPSPKPATVTATPEHGPLPTPGEKFSLENSRKSVQAIQ